MSLDGGRGYHAGKRQPEFRKHLSTYNCLLPNLATILETPTGRQHCLGQFLAFLQGANSPAGRVLRLASRGKSIIGPSNHLAPSES